MNIAAAVIAVLGLVVMALGCLCIIMVLSKSAEFLLRVGAVCFVLSGKGREPGLRALHAGMWDPQELLHAGRWDLYTRVHAGSRVGKHCCMLGGGISMY